MLNVRFLPCDLISIKIQNTLPLYPYTLIPLYPYTLIPNPSSESWLKNAGNHIFRDNVTWSTEGKKNIRNLGTYGMNFTLVVVMLEQKGIGNEAQT